MTCEAWDVVAVPFPFTDRENQKRRPAVVISKKSFNQHGYSLMAMITSSSRRWPTDLPVKDLASAGLSQPCVVRLKLFTLDNRLVIKQVGNLSGNDQHRVAKAIKSILPM
jgi:mRNA interferase MazF